MSFYAKPWTQISGHEISARYAFQTERLADCEVYGGMCGEPEPCSCGCSGWDEDWTDLLVRFDAGELGAAA